MKFVFIIGILGAILLSIITYPRIKKNINSNYNLYKIDFLLLELITILTNLFYAFLLYLHLDFISISPIIIYNTCLLLANIYYIYSYFYKKKIKDNYETIPLLNYNTYNKQSNINRNDIESVFNAG
tara:strand:+ start:1605 stop:1982 length:378 start_codon:yes stop_codon:yes gene_type:complete